MLLCYANNSNLQKDRREAKMLVSKVSFNNNQQNQSNPMFKNRATQATFKNTMKKLVYPYLGDGDLSIQMRTNPKGFFTNAMYELGKKYGKAFNNIERTGPYKSVKDANLDVNTFKFKVDDTEDVLLISLHNNVTGESSLEYNEISKLVFDEDSVHIKHSYKNNKALNEEEYSVKTNVGNNRGKLPPIELQY